MIKGQTFRYVFYIFRWSQIIKVICFHDALLLNTYRYSSKFYEFFRISFVPTYKNINSSILVFFPVHAVYAL